jgi:5'-nucleotidase
MNVIDTDPETDQIAIRNGYISVTPVHYDLTDRRMLEEMKGWGLGDLK